MSLTHNHPLSLILILFAAPYWVPRWSTVNSLILLGFPFSLAWVTEIVTWCKAVLYWVFCIVVQSLSRVRLFATTWTAARQTSLSITNSLSLLKLVSIQLMMPSNRLILCHPLLLLPLIFPSIRVFSSESAPCIMWPKYWSFSFSISPSNEYSELISFRMDWLDLLAVEGTLESLLQHHSSKASILQCSAFLWSNSHIHTWPLGNHSFDYMGLWLYGLLLANLCLCFLICCLGWS